MNLSGQSRWAGTKIAGSEYTPRQLSWRRQRNARLRESEATMLDSQVEASVPSPGIPKSPFNTGSMDITTSGATSSLLSHPIPQEKYIVVVRHGQTTWNLEGRIQGNTRESFLTEKGKEQARAARTALVNTPFDSCFTSPLPRALQTANILWEGRSGPIHHLRELEEANFEWLQGVENSVAARVHTDTYRAWRCSPHTFSINGRLPIVELFSQARVAWQELLEAPGQAHLVVTHKSILRAFVCTALGLPPSAFRAVDVNNGGVCLFRVNKNAEAMLTGLNFTTHLHHEGIKY